MNILKSSRGWAKIKKVGGICLMSEKDIVKRPILTIIDPDGWDRKNFEKSINEEITLQEFIKRITFSTIECKGDISEIFKKLE